MESRNPLFMSTVAHERNRFLELLQRCGILHDIYPSKHFFERVVERNLDAVDVLRMLTPIIRDFRETQYSNRSYCSQWKQFKLFAMITTGVVTGKRHITLKTMYDRDVDESNFDMVVKV